MMIELKVTVSDDLIPVLEAMAKLRGLASVDEVLSTLVAEQLAKLEESRNDPLIGMFDGPTDLSERDEEIMYGRRDDD